MVELNEKIESKVRICLDPRKPNELLEVDHEGTENMEIL